MGNKASGPFPAYDQAVLHYDETSIDKAKRAFRSYCSNGQTNINVINLTSFTEKSTCTPYMSKFVLPKLFTLIDTKKDGVIDFEEFICASSLMKFGNPEEKVKLLFVMYSSVKQPGMLTRLNLQEMLRDSNASAQSASVPLASMETWIEDMLEVLETMVDMAILQYGGGTDRLLFPEFFAFAKVEGSVQGLLSAIGNVLDR